MCVLSLVYTKVVPVKTCNIFPIPINVIKVPTLIYSICIVELTVRGRSHMIATHNSHSKWHVAFTGLLRALTVLGSNVLGGFSVLKIKGEIDRFQQRSLNMLSLEGLKITGATCCICKTYLEELVMISNRRRESESFPIRLVL